MTRLVVGLAGRRASGKTTIAETLEAKSGFARASFGGFVRATASARGQSSKLSSLEDLGRSLIAELGWDDFVKAVLSGTESTDLVVVDGIRHVAACNAIKRVVAARFVLVFVSVDERVRVQRLSSRGRPDDILLVHHEMTDELSQLQSLADCQADGSRDDAADRIVAFTDTSRDRP